MFIWFMLAMALCGYRFDGTGGYWTVDKHGAYPDAKFQHDTMEFGVFVATCWDLVRYNSRNRRAIYQLIGSDPMTV
jgi:hypothetical protein